MQTCQNIGQVFHFYRLPASGFFNQFGVMFEEFSYVFIYLYAYIHMYVCVCVQPYQNRIVHLFVIHTYIHTYIYSHVKRSETIFTSLKTLVAASSNDSVSFSKNSRRALGNICVCIICTYIYIYVYIYISSSNNSNECSENPWYYICAYIYKCIYVYMYIHIYKHLNIFFQPFQKILGGRSVCVRIFLCIAMLDMCVCKIICVCLCVDMYKCMLCVVRMCFNLFRRFSVLCLKDS